MGYKKPIPKSQLNQDISHTKRFMRTHMNSWVWLYKPCYYCRRKKQTSNINFLNLPGKFFAAAILSEFSKCFGSTTMFGLSKSRIWWGELVDELQAASTTTHDSLSVFGLNWWIFNLTFDTGLVGNGGGGGGFGTTDCISDTTGVRLGHLSCKSTGCFSSWTNASVTCSAWLYWGSFSTELALIGLTDLTESVLKSAIDWDCKEESASADGPGWSGPLAFWWFLWVLATHEVATQLDVVPSAAADMWSP